MCCKIIAVLVCITLATAQHGHHHHHHQATSYVSSDDFNAHTSHGYSSHEPSATLLKLPAYHHDEQPIAHHAVAPILIRSDHHHHPHHHHDEYAASHYAHPHYQFKYGVHDGHTHDVKEQQESRDGDAVKGSYTLLQPDGRTRTVHYTSNKHSGFHAHVQYSGHAQHPEEHHKAIIASPSYYHH